MEPEPTGDHRPSPIQGPFFISGYPRSGSTLLAAILRQNPSLHASYSSPVAALLQTMIFAMGAQSEHSPLLNTTIRNDVLKGVFHGYYRSVAERKPIIIDTNRVWCAKSDLLQCLFPGTRIIACVRDIGDIVESVERLIRASPQLHSRMFTNEEVANVYTRVEALMKPSGLVGIAESATREAAYSSNSQSLLILEYDFLVTRPKEAIDGIYAFLGMNHFTHDFTNVSSIDHLEYDTQIGIPALHKTRPIVFKQQHDPILPPDLAKKLQGRCFWREPATPRPSFSVLAAKPA